MERQQRSAALQQLLVLIVKEGDELFQRHEEELHLFLGKTIPFCFFTSIFNSLGKDPVISFEQLQILLNRFCEIFGVSVLVLHVEGDYTETEPTSGQSWIADHKEPGKILPKLKGVRWSVRN